MSQPEQHRTGSLRSVASNSSLVSLSRRSRTRTRSKTVSKGSTTGSSNPPSPFLDVEQSLVTEPEPITRVDSPQVTKTVVHSDRHTENDLPSQEVSSQPVHSHPILTDIDTVRANIASIRAGAGPAPSVVPRAVVNRDSVLTQTSTTQESTNASSLYPASTSTASNSGTESPPYPRSLSEQSVEFNPGIVDPQHMAQGRFDNSLDIADDVSFRLRLLVNNTYFIPPAHSKPSPLDFAHAAAKKPSSVPPSPGATFLDLFRGTKREKSKSPGLAGGPDLKVPALRTTSDSTTVSGYAYGNAQTHNHMQPQVQQNAIPAAPPTPAKERGGRVVVVREKMGDLFEAARAAEAEMKTRALRLDSAVVHTPTVVVLDVDPTDAVDLAPPSPSFYSPFPVGELIDPRANDALAVSSPFSPEEDQWRKQLLHEAVGLSLHEVSSMSMSQSGSSMPGSPRRVSTVSPRSGSAVPRARASSASSPRPVSMKRSLGQKIIDGNIDLPPRSVARMTSSSSLQVPRSPGWSTESHAAPRDSRQSNYLPLRAETPSGPQTPLGPAPTPRRAFLVHSANAPSESSMESQRPAVRRVVSTPAMSVHDKTPVNHSEQDTGEEEMQRRIEKRAELILTPPPRMSAMISSQFQIGQSQQQGSGRGHHRSMSQDTAGPSTLSQYSYATTEDGRPSVDSVRASIDSLMVPPSISESQYSQESQPSPTSSSFRESASMDGYAPPWDNVANPTPDAGPSTSSTPLPRFSTATPPPRVSSSLAQPRTILSPRPRSSSLHKIGMVRLGMRSNPGTPRNDTYSDPGHSTASSLRADSSDLTASRNNVYLTAQENPSSSYMSSIIPPVPLLPPSPIPQFAEPMNLLIPVQTSSPTSAFFDSIEAQGNAMDDLSSDEEDESVTRSEVNPNPRRLVPIPPDDSASSSSHGDAFTHTVSHNGSSVSLSIPLDIDRRPIGNVASKPKSNNVFFANKKKKDKGKDLDLLNSSANPSLLDVSGGNGNGIAAPSPVSYFNDTNNTGAGASGLHRSVSTRTQAWQAEQRGQAELRKLDGMLVMHMEAEKEAIKRIASGVGRVNS